MNRTIKTIAVLVCILLHSGCGEDSSLISELEMTPGLCFLHVHLTPEAETALLPPEAGSMFPVWLCDSLLTRGEMSVSLLGINLTDFSPQLLFLTRHMDLDELVDLASAGFDCRAEEAQDFFRLTDDRGSIIGAAASRSGWSGLITGSGADRSIQRWMELPMEESMAADTNLAAIAETESQITVLISQNSISFLSVIPTGGMTRQQVQLLNGLKDIIRVLRPEALKIGLVIQQDERLQVDLELELVRDHGEVSTLSVSFTDTVLKTEQITQALHRLIEL